MYVFGHLLPGKQQVAWPSKNLKECFCITSISRLEGCWQSIYRKCLPEHLWLTANHIHALNCCLYLCTSPCRCMRAASHISSHRRVIRHSSETRSSTAFTSCEFCCLRESMMSERHFSRLLSSTGDASPEKIERTVRWMVLYESLDTTYFHSNYVVYILNHVTSILNHVIYCSRILVGLPIDHVTYISPMNISCDSTTQVM